MFNKTLRASKRILQEKLTIALLPNSMIWRNDCDPFKESSADIVAIHCRVVGNLLVTQEQKAQDKSNGIRAMGAWFLDEHGQCDYGIKYSHIRTQDWQVKDAASEDSNSTRNTSHTSGTSEADIDENINATGFD